MPLRKSRGQISIFKPQISFQRECITKATPLGHSHAKRNKRTVNSMALLRKCSDFAPYGDDAPGIIGIPYTVEWQNHRLNAIIRNKIPCDPWNQKSISPFYLSARELLERAVRTPPRHASPSASSFAAWIYSLYCYDFDPRVLHKAKQAEDEILEAKRIWTSRSEFQNFHLSAWQQIHCGMGFLDSNENHKYFNIPSLRLNGVPLQAVPDLVFQHKHTGHIIILEVKFSMANIPANLWPNIWAQLWVYSKIPQFSSAPYLTCVGEIWGENARGWAKDNLASSVYLRSTVRRNPRDASFDKFFMHMFKIFNGTFEEK